MTFYDYMSSVNYKLKDLSLFIIVWKAGSGSSSNHLTLSEVAISEGEAYFYCRTSSPIHSSVDDYWGWKYDSYLGESYVRSVHKTLRGIVVSIEDPPL